ncbi:TPA: transposase [Yersinia enterocolitica]|nr:transposase [Yersinia enterocolitica]
MTSKSANRYPAELREHAVRMLLGQHNEYKSEHAAFNSIAPKIGCNPYTLRAWVRQHERGFGACVSENSLTTSERQRLKELERENRELRRSNDILRQASAYFAQAELVYGRLLFAK